MKINVTLQDVKGNVRPEYDCLFCLCKTASAKKCEKTRKNLVKSFAIRK